MLPHPVARVRTQGELHGASFSYFGQDDVGNLIYSDTINNVALTGNMRYMSDVVTRPYSKAVTKGIRINNPMSMQVQTYSLATVSGRKRTNSQTGASQTETGPTVAIVFGALENNLPTNHLDEGSIGAQATLKTWEKVAPVTTQGLVTILESHKSFAMIIDRARKLAKVVEACRSKDVKAIKALLGGSSVKAKPLPRRYAVWDEDGRPLLTKRGNIRKSSSYTSNLRMTNDPTYIDDAARLWLEYRMGWSPLVMDIVNALKAVYEADLRAELLPRDVHRAIGVAKEEQASVHALDSDAGGLRHYGSKSVKYICQSTGYVHYRWSAPEGLVRRLNDFGLFDLPKSVWELVPFSFLVDRIAPVGEWLGALTPKIGVEYLDMGHSTERWIIASQTVSSYPAGELANASWPPIASVGSSDTMNVYTKERRTYLGIPVFPPIVLQCKLKQMADVAALLRSKR